MLLLLKHHDPFLEYSHTDPNNYYSQMQPMHNNYYHYHYIVMTLHIHVIIVTTLINSYLADCSIIS